MPATFAPGRISRIKSHAPAGFLLSLGAPVGLAVTRALLGTGIAMTDDVSREAPTYLYVLLSTAVVFSAFGAVMGRAADRRCSRGPTA